VAEWVDGEKLSQSAAGDVSSLVAVGMIAYLTQVPVHPTPYALRPTPYALHPTPYTLHPTPYTLMRQIACLSQLLESGFFHADPHPGNMLRTPDGRLAILDFGLMTQV
jgi:aarF domain-containing kinase